MANLSISYNGGGGLFHVVDCRREMTLFLSQSFPFMIALDNTLQHGEIFKP